MSRYNCDTDSRNSDNNSPLHVAAQHQQHKVLMVLITEFNCDVNVKGHMGRSLLHLACLNGDANLVKMLTKYISPLVADDTESTPLHVCSALSHTNYVKLLLEVNAPIYHGEE